MKLNEIKERINDLEDLNTEIQRIETVLNQGINQIVIKENYYLRSNIFESEKFKSEVESLLRKELEHLNTQRNFIHKQLNIEEEEDE